MRKLAILAALGFVLGAPIALAQGIGAPISQYPAATLPLGSEATPVVQSGTTKQAPALAFGIPYAGTSAPTPIAKWQLWVDTATNPNTLEEWDGSAWIPLLYLNSSAHTAAIPTTNGGTGQATPQASRSCAGLNIDCATSVGDGNYSILATDRTLLTDATLTAPRVWTLPAAASVNPGQALFVLDSFGAINSSNTISIIPGGSDHIANGPSVPLTAAYGAAILVSDGVSVWTAYGTTFGGQACTTNQFVKSLVPPGCQQPSAGNITGLAASATTDTTNAGNITSGTLSNARLANVPNSALQNDAVTVNGQAIPLGGTGNINAPPNGAASGDLCASYPNPTVCKINGATPAASATTDTTNAANITSGTLSNSRLANVPNTALQNSSVTVNGQPISLGGSGNINAPPNGSASGDLSGTYPGPTVGKVNGGTPGVTCGASQYVNAINSSAQGTCGTIAAADVSGAGGIVTGTTGVGPVIWEGANWSSWGNYATTFALSGFGCDSTNAPVMGGQSTPSNQATYGSFDRVVQAGCIYNGSMGGEITGVTFDATHVYFASAQSCTLFHARSGNNGGTNLSTNDSPNFVGEVTNVNCSGSTTTNLTVGAGWFQQIGSHATAVSTLNAGGSGYNNGDVLVPATGRGYAWPLSVTLTTVVGGAVQSGGYTLFGGSYQQGSYFQPLASTNMIDVTTPSATGAQFTFTFTNVAANTSSGQVPAGNAVIYNPNTKIWYFQPDCILNTPPGNTIALATLEACGEVDADNNTGVDDYFASGGNFTGGIWGWDVVNLGANMSGNAYLCRGKFLNCYLAGDGSHTLDYGLIYQPLNGQTPGPVALFTTQQAGAVISAESQATGTALILNQFGANGERTIKLDDIGVLSLGAENNGTTVPKLDLYSSGTAQGSPDARITASGGNGTLNGTMTLDANTVKINNSSNQYIQFTETSGAANITSGSGQNIVLNSQGEGTGFVQIPCGSTCVNFIQVSNAITGTSPSHQCVGSDTNVNCLYVTKGTGAHIFRPGSDGTAFRVQNAAGSTDYLDVNTSTGKVILSQFSTAGILLNDNFGDIINVTSAPAATTPASFSATNRIPITIGSTTYYVPADTATW